MSFYRGGGSGLGSGVLTPSNGTLAPFRRGLSLAELPLTLNVYGDSTGNDSTDWPRRMVTMTGTGLAAQWPAFSWRHLLWSDTAQAYTAIEQQSTGATGHGHIATGATDFVTTPDSAAVSVVGDLHVQALVWVDDLTAAGEHVIAAKFGAAGNRSWRWYTSAGGLLVDWSVDGTALTTHNLGSVISLGLPSGQWIWLEWKLDVDNGSGGYTSTIRRSSDLATWTTVGTPATVAGVTSLFDSTAPLCFGARAQTETGAASSAGHIGPGRLGSMILRNGLDGPIVAGFTAGRCQSGVGTSTGYGGETWTQRTSTSGTATTLAQGGAREMTAYNACHAGSVLSYADDATRFPKMTPNVTDLAIVNYGHNETSEPAAWAAAVGALISRIRTTSTLATILLAIQNPQTSGATNPAQHARRCRGLRQYAAINNHAVVDAYRLFKEYGAWDPNLMTDAVHPNATGYDLWAATGARAFAGWL